MQNNHPRFKITVLLLLFSVATVSLFNFSTCNGKKQFPTCVSLTKAQIQNWILKGYLTSQDTNSIVRLKAAYAFPGTTYKVYAGVQRPDGTLIDSSIIELLAIDTCSKTHINLNEYVFSGSLQVRVADWNLWKSGSQNTLKDSLKYIQLDPYDYNYESLPLLAFHDFVVNKSGTRTPVIHYDGKKMIIYSVLPCPPCPNCKNPCPPPSTCTSPCNEILIDSTDNN